MGILMNTHNVTWNDRWGRKVFVFQSGRYEHSYQNYRYVQGSNTNPEITLIDHCSKRWVTIPMAWRLAVILIFSMNECFETAVKSNIN